MAEQNPAQPLIDGLLSGDRTMLSRSITMVESKASKHKPIASELIHACLPHSGKSMRIGITGVPGSGKSTFIETMGNLLIDAGHKVAVLAIDPSSQQSGGSILGDKTRMERLSVREQAFIRPSPSGTTLGGVARKTRETIILCEAAGFDTILIETVGVGQSEIAVDAMVDCFLLLLLSGAGDELQGIKRGIMEMADIIAVNKADGNNEKTAANTKMEIRRAIELLPKKNNFHKTQVTECSAMTGKGVGEIIKLLEHFIFQSKESHFFEENRKHQSIYWMHETIKNQLIDRFYQSDAIRQLIHQMEKSVEDGSLNPFEAAERLLNRNDY